MFVAIFLQGRILIETFDFLVIGGGVMGITLAIGLKREFCDARILLVEKENDVALHASGRNSGVLHAGFYYTANSMKARFTRNGNLEMRAYCEEKGLRINKCGKLVICQSEAELKGLDELASRGRANGVELEKISEAEAREIEPNIKTHGAALWSPHTASVDPVEVVGSMARDARELGVEIRTGSAYLGRNGAGKIVRTSTGDIEAGYVINAAGLYADRIAGEYGFSKSYRILPFKGLYLYAREKSYRPRVHIYPVPDLVHPFLGVHFTLTVDGKVKIGPTAIPVLWRENYGGFDGFNVGEMAEISLRELKLWLGNNFGFRRLAWEETKKYYKPHMIAEADKMLHRNAAMEYGDWARPGIRAQLVNIDENRLEMDFIYEYDDKSFHLLNAVSPAFTCSLPISRFLVEEIKKAVG